MAFWKNFEIDCTAYLNNTFRDYATFCTQELGGSCSHPRTFHSPANNNIDIYDWNLLSAYYVKSLTLGGPMSTPADPPTAWHGGLYYHSPFSS